MRKPTAEDKAKSRKKKIDRDKHFGRGLIALGEGHGVKIKTVSRQQFFKELAFEELAFGELAFGELAFGESESREPAFNEPEDVHRSDSNPSVTIGE